ncbi:hypothetical protein M378DRAFT_76311 [Amanita muscaria Koide BX008]|uniref:Uncharacterized protein n=1 Tax=Amanita muscaria (strain Koide BX008) TaxID=946122 RepID=A0A0C2X9G2_AMAMK|nr:hypothetical protein M378DRAFT_76311 [Amanita muscaria Koide BX008]
MPYTAFALLIGLGARILLDTFTRTHEPNLRDILLVGAWQGVALQYSYKSTDYVLFVGLGILAKLFHDFNSSKDFNRLCATVLGSVVGFISTDFIAQVFEDPPVSTRGGRRKSVSQRSRTVQFRGTVDGDSERALKRRHAISDITSIDSDSELIPAKETMTPVQREIAALRARASLADSERRRYKEERKWAISQGNLARASQMKWEIKRYTALMEDFNKQADAKLVEAAQQNGRLPSQAATSSRTRVTHANGSARQTEANGARPSGSNQTFTKSSTSQRNGQVRNPHHRQFSGTLKSAMRDPIR